MLRCIVLVYIVLKLYILDHFQWRFYHFIGRFLEILLEIIQKFLSFLILKIEVKLCGYFESVRSS